MIPTNRGIPAPDLGEWTRELRETIESPALCDLAAFLAWKSSQGTEIYPPADDVFNALRYTAPENVKVVVLGQDPYHGEGQAHGLAFSVREGIAFPPSLRNIFKELEDDLGFKEPSHGNLTSWAKNGVLLLNTILTVEKGNPLSHKNKGWEVLTDAIISHVSENTPPCVFILWGSQAHKKESLIDGNRHCIIKNVHPSPLSAHRGFFGSKPFSKANKWLVEQGREPVQWELI